MPRGWQWDETLYRGSAPYYARGRLPYAPELADRLAQTLMLNGRGRLLDVGCGPGVLTLALAHHFAQVVAVDPDPGMLAEGERRAAQAGLSNVSWLRARAEELPDDLGSFHAATFGQSFHWMDRDQVARTMLGLLEPGGAFVHVSDVKEPGDTEEGVLPHPEPPYSAIRALVRAYLGPVPRAGQGHLRYGSPSGEAEVLRCAGFGPRMRLRVPAGEELERSADDLVAWVYSLSGSAPHLFANRQADFERDLRRILHERSATGIFSEQPPDTEVFIWRRP